jgi:hypothetical protein
VRYVCQRRVDRDAISALTTHRVSWLLFQAIAHEEARHSLGRSDGIIRIPFFTYPMSNGWLHIHVLSLIYGSVAQQYGLGPARESLLDLVQVPVSLARSLHLFGGTSWLESLSAPTFRQGTARNALRAFIQFL